MSKIVIPETRGDIGFPNLTKGDLIAFRSALVKPIKAKRGKRADAIVIKKRKKRQKRLKKRTKKRTKKKNPWLVHVQKVRKQNPDTPYKDVLTLAKLTYKKSPKFRTPTYQITKTPKTFPRQRSFKKV